MGAVYPALRRRFVTLGCASSSSNRRAGHGQRLKDKRRIQPRQARTAVFLRDIKPPEPKFRKLRPEGLGDGALVLPLAGKGGDVFLTKGTRHIEDGGLFLRECKIHVSPVH